ncbi:MAG: hypothetical protein EBV42_00650, partial [Actinobacteria bacterium]|nr:hypothetical protein [Actinomycetota bacterium]
YTLFVWITSFGGRVWSFVALTQVILLSLGLASLGRAIISRGYASRDVYTAIAVLALMPQFGSFAVTAWKDVPSSAGALMFAASLISEREPSRVMSRADLLTFLGALLLASFRWNGPIALLMVCIYLAATRQKSKVSLLSITLTALVIGGSSLVLPQRLHLAESTVWFHLEIRELHDIAYVVRSSPDAFAKGDLDLLQQIMPLENWERGGASCETVDVLQYEEFTRNAPASYEATRKLLPELRALWRRILVERPSEILKVRLCRASGALSPIYFGKHPTLGIWGAGSPDPELARARIFPPLESTFSNIGERILRPEWMKTIFLNASLWNVLSLLILWRQRARRFYGRALVVSASIICSVALGAVAHDARYVAGALLIAQLFVFVTTIESLRQLWRAFKQRA